MDKEELFAMAQAMDTEEYCMLESDTSRVVVVPDRYKTFGVEEDTNVERVKFKFPKIVGDNVDLTTLNLRINFQNASGGLDKYAVDDVAEADDGYITFSWAIQDGVTPQSGQISFVVQAVKSTEDGTVEKKWSTTLNKIGQVLEGLEVDETIEQQNQNIIESILTRLDKLEESGGGGVTTDHANTLWAIIQKAAFAEQLTDEELTAFKTAWGIEAVVVPATGIRLNKTILSFTDSSSQTLIATVEPSNSTDSVTWETSDAGIATVSSGVVSPVSNGSCTITAKAGSYSASCKVTVNVSEEIVTLQSISVTYAGGEVTVGTALTDLTGITVTAHYSNGSTDTITGYTLSGEIVEGENTIMVSYGGKTTTFTVVGYVEEAETTEPVYRLAEATTFDGTNTVDTGYALCENYKAFTVVVDFTSTTKSGSVFGCDKDASYGVGVKCQSGYYWSAYWSSNVNKDVHNASNGVKYVITHEVNSNIAKAYYIYEDELTTQEFTVLEGNYNSNMDFTNTVILGNGFTGIINDFKIYESVLSQEEINAYVGV